MDEIANPETGAMTAEQAVDLLRSRRAPEAAAEPEQPEAEQAEEEETPEPGDEPDDGEPEEAETDPDADEPEEPARYAVKIDGEEVEVTLEELRNGYQRDADYRRKTQALADERRSIESQRQQIESLNAQLAAALQSVGDEKEPDWVQLSKELDPWEFQQQRVAWEAKSRARSEAKASMERVAMQQRMAHAKAEAAKLADKVPEWRDPARFQADFAAIAKDAERFFGLSEADLHGIVDHRSMIALRDAVEFRRLKARGPAVEKKVSAAPKKVQAPGATASKAARAADEAAKARDRLKRSGSIHDAVALLKSRRV